MFHKTFQYGSITIEYSGSNEAVERINTSKPLTRQLYIEVSSCRPLVGSVWLVSRPHRSWVWAICRRPKSAIITRCLWSATNMNGVSVINGLNVVKCVTANKRWPPSAMPTTRPKWSTRHSVPPRGGPQPESKCVIWTANWSGRSSSSGNARSRAAPAPESDWLGALRNSTTEITTNSTISTAKPWAPNQRNMWSVTGPALDSPGITRIGPKWVITDQWLIARSWRPFVRRLCDENEL